MKPNRRIIILAALVLLVGTGAFFVTRATAAQGDPRQRPRQQGDRHQRLAGWLGMEPEQLQQLKEADPKFHADMRVLKNKVEIERLHLANLVQSDDATDTQLRAQFTKLGEAQMAINSRIGEHVLALRPLLDADQRAKFFDKLSQHLRGQRGGPQGQGPHPGPGMRGGKPGSRDGQQWGPRPDGARPEGRRPGGGGPGGPGARPQGPPPIDAPE